MKTKFVLFFNLIFTIGSLMAGNPTATIEGTRTLVVNFTGWKAPKVHVEITAASGDVVLKEDVRPSATVRKYNLKNLPEGSYTLIVNDDLRVSAQPFEIDREGVVLSLETETTYKPVINNDSDYLDFNLFAKGNPVNITILDAENNVLFREAYRSAAIHKRFDISSFRKGRYTFFCEMGGKQYFKEFVK